MRWVLVAAAAVLGAAVTWVLTARGDADRPDSVDHLDQADEGADSSAFGGTPTPPSAVTGPAEGWMPDAQDEDALLARSEALDAPADGKGPDVGVGATMNIPPVPSATASGDVAGVGKPETVAAVEAESEAKAPTPADEAAEDPHHE
ncbi:hypothetical protein [Terrabacter sp. MAHUQ-38]|uniref:hypothetical protein n=1 Tax=unclassified Terrabacter TaxID=2630222 RepID=UPI00165DCA80|nr:hypothetical protein [Terrabacter sp. MAHUQ-38]MBC9823095.1 hypothetical protein [Terrabacter sp. MAHUQ-38]